ncbi:MAG: prepilin peptidase [Bryobacteraceae bacterium]|nr:prepilin peptidase [Bryobacteraceae bacterium]MDW8377099.1 prepilin peptidase [Bryobacterales bacterium]
MIEAVLAGLLGLLVGSFLNVCIYRLPRDLSVVRPRSHCPSCQRTIAWYDNVPIASYLWLGGKCRWCRTPYSISYPLVEFFTGVSFFFSVLSKGWNPLGWKLCVLSAILIDLIVTDLFDRILPDEFTLGGFLMALVFAPFTPPPSQFSTLFLPPTLATWIHSLAEALLGGLISATLLWLTGEVYLRIRKREGLGLGDVKMMLVVGGFLGLPGALMTVFAGSLLGAILGGLYMLVTKKGQLYELPFGTFLGTAALGIALFGEYVLSWYLDLLTS